MITKMPIDKFTVQEGERKQDVFIAMAPDEANDRSYREYLIEAEKEKTADQLKKKSAKPKTKLSKTDQVEAVKELKAYREDKKTRTVPRYFSGDYTS